MRTALALSSFLLLTACANAQDLFNDFNRGILFSPTQTGKLVANVNGMAMPYRVGFVEFATQPLLEFHLGAVGKVVDNFYNDGNPNVIGTTPSTYTSGIWWNFGATDFTLPDKRVIPATAVTLQNSGLIPTVEVEYPKSTDVVTVTMEATPVGGASTPGRIVFQTFANGVWTPVYDLALTGKQTSVRKFTFASKTRLRFMLVQKNGSKALAQATLSLRIE